MLFVYHKALFFVTDWPVSNAIIHLIVVGIFIFPFRTINHLCFDSAHFVNIRFICKIDNWGNYLLMKLQMMSTFVCLAAPVAERLRALFLNHSIISPLCLVWVRALLWLHMRQAKFCVRVCQFFFFCFFFRFSRFRPTY